MNNNDLHPDYIKACEALNRSIGEDAEYLAKFGTPVKSTPLEYPSVIGCSFPAGVVGFFIPDRKVHPSWAVGGAIGGSFDALPAEASK